MPSKKPEPTATSLALTASAQSQQDVLMSSIEEFELPRAVVNRSSKIDLPDHVKFSQDTSTALVRGASVFITYLSSAQDVAKSRAHKNIAGADVLKALELTGFGHLAAQLEDDLEAQREGGTKRVRPRDGTTKKKSASKDDHTFKGRIRETGGRSSAPGSGAASTSAAADGDTPMNGTDASDREDYTTDDAGGGPETGDEDVDDEDPAPYNEDDDAEELAKLEDDQRKDDEEGMEE